MCGFSRVFSATPKFVILCCRKYLRSHTCTTLWIPATDFVQKLQYCQHQDCLWISRLVLQNRVFDENVSFVILNFVYCVLSNWKMWGEEANIAVIYHIFTEVFSYLVSITSVSFRERSFNFPNQWSVDVSAADKVHNCGQLVFSNKHESLVDYLAFPEVWMWFLKW